jgi:hypothetical protein
MERQVGRAPEARQQADQDVERSVGVGVREQRPGLAALEQHRPAVRVVLE